MTLQTTMVPMRVSKKTKRMKLVQNLEPHRNSNASDTRLPHLPQENVSNNSLKAKIPNPPNGPKASTNPTRNTASPVVSTLSTLLACSTSISQPPPVHIPTESDVLLVQVVQECRYPLSSPVLNGAKTKSLGVCQALKRTSACSNVSKNNKPPAGRKSRNTSLICGK